MRVCNARPRPVTPLKRHVYPGPRSVAFVCLREVKNCTRPEECTVDSFFYLFFCRFLPDIDSGDNTVATYICAYNICIYIFYDCSERYQPVKRAYRVELRLHPVKSHSLDKYHWPP